MGSTTCMVLTPHVLHADEQEGREEKRMANHMEATGLANRPVLQPEGGVTGTRRDLPRADVASTGFLSPPRDVLPGMNAGASLSAVPSPIEGSGTAWVLLGSWALSPARPTPIPPRHECRGFSALLVILVYFLAGGNKKVLLEPG